MILQLRIALCVDHAIGAPAPDGAVQRTTADLAEIAARLKQGEGSVGRLLTDQTLARDLEATAASARSR